VLTAAQISPRLEVHALEGREVGWRDYLRRNQGASLYHRLEVKQVVEQTFGHRCHYLMACANGEVRGVLPLVEMRSRLFGHFLVSLPFFDYGGILAEDAWAQQALAEAAIAKAMQTGASHIELRQTGPLELAWTARQHKVALVLPLAGDPDPHWQGLSSRLRGKVRKAQKAGAQFSVHGAEALPAFYGVFAKNMRDLGTPVYPRRLFAKVFDVLGDAVRLFLVQLDGRPAAGAIGLSHEGRLELPWICSDYACSKNYVNEFLYWSVVEWACRRRYLTLDFGRSSVGSGPYRFKSQWGPEEKPLYWYYWTARGTELPQLSPDNPRYGLAIRCWRNLPLALANTLGPRIVKHVP
jgi:FemAB-related protein (PEP-CTERM system-associated)